MKKNITLSIITPTLNNERDIAKFLSSLRKQYFPKSRLEIIIADGGSTDKTRELARKFGAKVIDNKEVFADAGVNLGMSIAKGNIFMVLATDNFFKSRNSLFKMVEVFKDEKIYAAFPKQSSTAKDTIYTKYINTFTDPVNHFVYDYASNPRTFDKVFDTLKKTKDYTLFDYKSSKTVPLIAFAQGFTVRSSFHRNSKNAFDDVAPVIELIKKNKKIVYVHSVDLYHHTINSLSHFINKQAWRTRNYLERKNFGISHRVLFLSKKQTDRIRYWPLYSLTLLPPFIYGAYHLLKDKEKMWIFHPFLCIISGYTSLFSAISFYANKKK